MGTCISRCDCSCTRSSPVLPQQQQRELPQPTIQDKLVILTSSPLPSTYPLANSSSSSPVKPPPPSSPSLSSTPSTAAASNRSSSISCTSSTFSNVYASASSSSSTFTYTSSSVSSELGRSFSDEFQWSNVKKHPHKPRRNIQPALSQQQQQKAPPPRPVPHMKPPPRHRVAPTNTSSCPKLQNSFRKDQRISSITRTTSERECVGMSVDDVGKARCSSNNCNAKTHNRRPDGARGGGRPHDSEKRKQKNEKVRQKKLESRVHHMMDVPALLADDQMVDRRGSSHRYCPGEDNDNSLVALDCFIFL